MLILRVVWFFAEGHSLPLSLALGLRGTNLPLPFLLLLLHILLCHSLRPQEHDNRHVQTQGLERENNSLKEQLQQSKEEVDYLRALLATRTHQLAELQREQEVQERQVGRLQELLANAQSEKKSAEKRPAELEERQLMYVPYSTLHTR